MPSGSENLHGLRFGWRGMSAHRNRSGRSGFGWRGLLWNGAGARRRCKVFSLRVEAAKEGTDLMGGVLEAVGWTELGAHAALRPAKFAVMSRSGQAFVEEVLWTTTRPGLYARTPSSGASWRPRRGAGRVVRSLDLPLHSQKAATLAVRNFPDLELGAGWLQVGGGGALGCRVKANR